MAGGDWFTKLFGYEEYIHGGVRGAGADVTGANRRQFEVSGVVPTEKALPSVPSDLRSDGTVLVSRANGATFRAGHFFCPTVAEIRAAAIEACGGGGGGGGGNSDSAAVIRHTHIAVGDILLEHAKHPGAMFMAASQWNCLEFANPRAIPENGIAGYEYDRTQGPACALACAAGTVVRNYFAMGKGQSRDDQIDNLATVGDLLGNHGNARFWTVENGYTFSSEEKLTALAGEIGGRDNRDALVDGVRIGAHLGTEVTHATRWKTPPSPVLVSQAYCSAISCAYSGIRNDLWRPLATIALDGAYEATLWAAALDKARGKGSGTVFLTKLGGGVFGNDDDWIAGAIARALHRARAMDLDVKVCHFRSLDTGFVENMEAKLALLESGGGERK